MIRLVGLGLLAGCAGAHPGAMPAPCPTVPADRLLGSVFIDGRRIADGVPLVQTAREPESYDFVGEPPPAIRDLPVDRIALIQYVSGDPARTDHGACPGMVAVLITTRAGR